MTRLRNPRGTPLTFPRQLLLLEWIFPTSYLPVLGIRAHQIVSLAQVQANELLDLLVQKYGWISKHLKSRVFLEITLRCLAKRVDRGYQQYLPYRTPFDFDFVAQDVKWYLHQGIVTLKDRYTSPCHDLRIIRASKRATIRSPKCYQRSCCSTAQQNLYTSSDSRSLKDLLVPEDQAARYRRQT